ncbi:RND transporter [Methyloprofundus sedimenti]|uniref:RND transporter n=1 Tax=Methyloprofundus sedimenti TaxID=1420851 RepID=A0A1V8M536_9GAMM|nr:efflux RND transporter periplasmic adaptor subunit [Methyloprofundus sedimenti]OQK16680.1 RND transporter [Methyloprofundus sedimenti]
MNKKLLLICALISIAAAVGYYFSKGPERISVTQYKVAQGEVKASIANTRVGTVKACRRAYLAPAIGGNVAQLYVKEGDKVKSQQLLLKVWNDDLTAQLILHKAQIKANQATAKQFCEIAAGTERDSQRLSRLKKYDRIISEEQLDRAATKARADRAQCQAAQVAIEIARAKLEIVNTDIERTLVRAPFDGTVAEINAELGEYVTPSPPGIPTLPPIDLLDISCLYVSAPIDEVDAPQVKVGMSACVSLDAFAKKRCSGTVSRIAPYVLEKEKQARTVEVEVKLSDAKDLQELLPGYSADIEVLLASKEKALRVPTEAVLENNQVLLITADGVLEQRQFKPGLANWNFIEVLSGLKEGDALVLSVGREGVEPGAYVRVEE